ncbi:hypothetical protein TNCV_2508601 [Trichonephila clavipes]|nr:hypothetical protein TNCV_2508601 [Trichonephila clavipes]
MTSFSDMCYHSWQECQETFLIRQCLPTHNKYVIRLPPASLPPFPGRLDPQISHKSSTSGIIWDGKLDS